MTDNAIRIHPSVPETAPALIMNALTNVVLASASPRRVELIRSLGMHVEIRPTGYPEDDVPGLSPRELAAHHSAAKADAALRDLADPAASTAPARTPADVLTNSPPVLRNSPPGEFASTAAAVLITADTVVDRDGASLGKPGDVAEARAMLRSLSGREHLVHTAVDVVVLGDGRRHAFVETTAVRFFALDDDVVDRYAASRDGLDKAGAYGIQGLGASLVERIDGDFYAVMGFPIGRFVQALRGLGYVPAAFAAAPAGAIS